MAGRRVTSQCKHSRCRTGMSPSDFVCSDEHRKRSPDCAFFIMVDQAPAPKRPRATKARASKASRLSTQSVATTMSDLQSAAGDMTLDPDLSVMTTTSVATQGGKKGRPRKAATAKTRKTKAKKEEAVEI